MGYRELLKRYILFLELNVGDNFIEDIPNSAERFMSDRDLGELRSLAAEIFREAVDDPKADAPQNYNHMFRLLVNRHGLDMETAAALAARDESTVRRWRTSPRSSNYLPMTDAEFRSFEQSLFEWLETPGESPGQLRS